MIAKLYKISEGLNVRSGGGDDPFQIVTRLAEECKEVAAEVNHLEGQGAKTDKLGVPDRQKMAKELTQVIGVVLDLAMHYGLQQEMRASVEKRYQQVVAEGLVDPLSK